MLLREWQTIITDSVGSERSESCPTSETARMALLRRLIQRS